MLEQNIRKRRMELGLTQSELGDKIKVLDKNPSVSNDGLVVKFKPALEQAQGPRHREFSKWAPSLCWGR